MMSKYELESIENEIIEQLDKGGKVIIESGAANDSIFSYVVNVIQGNPFAGNERNVVFTTSACVFPEKIELADFDHVETNEWNDCLFVKAR